MTNGISLSCLVPCCLEYIVLSFSLFHDSSIFIAYLSVWNPVLREPKHCVMGRKSPLTQRRHDLQKEPFSLLSWTSSAPALCSMGRHCLSSKTTCHRNILGKIVRENGSQSPARGPSTNVRDPRRTLSQQVREHHRQHSPLTMQWPCRGRWVPRIHSLHLQ